MKYFLNRIKNGKLSNFLICFLTISFLFLFMVLKMKYALVFDDDIREIFSHRYDHYRYLTTWLIVFFVNLLPKFFNIHVQDFAFISENLFKSVLFSLMIIIITQAFFKFSKNYKLYPIIYTGVFFYLYFLPFILNFWVYLQVNIFFMGYFFPIIFFILFWYKIGDYYICNDDGLSKSLPISKKDKILLVIYPFLIWQGNEIILLLSNILLFILLIDSLIFNNKNFKKNYMYLFLPFLIFSLLCLFIITFPIELLTSVYKFHFCLPSQQEFKIFNFLFLTEVFYKNILLWLADIIGFILLLFVNEKYTAKKIFKYCLYLLISILIIFYITLFLPINCPYTDNKYKFWLLCPHLLLQIKFILLLCSLYVAGFLSVSTFKFNKFSRFFNYALVLILIIFSGIYLRPFIFTSENKNYYELNMKQKLYIADKISLFYLKQGKTIIFPYNEFFQKSILNVRTPGSLENYNNEIYHKGEDVDYLEYIENVYKADVSPGIKFQKDNDAISIYLKNGGEEILKNEIEELDFSKLNEN